MMIKTILKWVAGGLAITVVTLLVLYLNRTNPYGILPGRQLTEEEVPGPIDDWSFAREYRRLTLEVRPSDPYSVNTGYILREGDLYVLSGGGENSRWAQFLIQDPNLRIRIGDKLYPARATHVKDPAVVSDLHRILDERNPSREERTPEELARRAGFWFFRMDSR